MFKDEDKAISEVTVQGPAGQTEEVCLNFDFSVNIRICLTFKRL